MKRTHILTLILVLITGLVGGLIAGNLAPQSARAQPASEVSRTFGPKWEYCAITDVSGSSGQKESTGLANICYFQSSGCRIEETKVILDSNKHLEAKASAVAQAAAKLGNEGWEMVGESTRFQYSYNSTPSSLYFKRQQR